MHVHLTGYVPLGIYWLLVFDDLCLFFLSDILSFFLHVHTLNWNCPLRFLIFEFFHVPTDKERFNKKNENANDTPAYPFPST
jgi:hypothetical protein